jgi:hypothetical protein
MKKQYETPTVEVVNVNMEGVMCLSNQSLVKSWFFLDSTFYSNEGWLRDGYSNETF